ncbi:MAG: cyclase family protein [Actinomycetota bacterium]|nr:MAG: cyclase family protein [Actinomycetota bacterium]
MPLTADLQQLAARVSNWGRWGDDDRRGTLNLVDEAAVARGLAAARQGRTFSLAMPFDADGPQLGFIEGRVNPELTMVAVNHSLTGDPGDFTTSDDAVTMGLQCATHWDSLAHVGYDGLLYNGVPMSDTDATGSAQLGIERFGPVVTRGVLLDVARLHGVDHFDDGYPISGDDLERASAAAGVVVLPGDVVCVRTGHQHWLRSGDKLHYSMPSPGLSTKSIEWVRDHDVAAVATDTLVFECYPPEDPAVMLPVHMIHIRDIGLVQGQNWVLDTLGADCAADGQYDFLLVATPLPFTKAVGGPVAPTAVK